MAVLTKYEDLRERVVRIGNVLNADGEPCSVYVVLTGLGRYLRHYLGVRRGGANVQICVNVGTGANDGLLTLKVKTRNQRGIAPKSPLVLNFGQQYEFAYGDQPAPKKFKGVLDAHFDKLRAAELASQEQAEKAAGQDKEKEQAEKEKAEKEKADKEKADKEKEQAEKEKAEKEKAEKETADKKKGAKTEAEKAKEQVEKVNAEKEKADRDKAEKEKASQGKGDWEELGKSVGGHKCMWNGTSLKLEMGAGITGNKKVPPKTTLAFTKEGKICNTGNSFAWTFDTGKDLVLDAARLDGPTPALGPDVVETLATYMERVGATQVIKQPWTLEEVKSGKKLKAGTSMTFMAEKDMWRAILECTKSMAQCAPCWLVRNNKKEARVFPVGVALLLKKQVVLTSEVASVLQ